MAGPLVVEVENLVKTFPATTRGFFQKATLTAVNDISLEVAPGETLGLVGESGSGKSTVANIVAGLLPRTSGHVVVNGVDFSTLNGRQLREQRRHVQVVFQDPYGSMAPTSTIEASIMEPLRAHKVGDREGRRARVDELLAQVQLDRSLKSRFPTELSGGQLQRVSIARALALEPKLLVLDEPTSALDVSTKAEIVNLLADLKEQLSLSYLFISHDLSTLRVLVDRVAVMYLGEIVEEGTADQVYDHPLHPYTKALLGSVPVPDPVVQRRRERIVLQGDIPSPLAVPSGCSFHTRCPEAMPQCSDIHPAEAKIGSSYVSCHLYPPA
jgi:oligopeptide/dipeptide ABC transporter ATP-binding protein